MQPAHQQEPARYPEPSHGGAAWLNGITWAIMVVCFLLAGASQGYEALLPLLMLLLVAGVGAVANLLLGLGCYATGRRQQAGPYLMGFFPLALIAWWLASEFSHIGKIGG